MLFYPQNAPFPLIMALAFYLVSFYYIYTGEKDISLYAFIQLRMDVLEKHTLQ